MYDARGSHQLSCAVGRFLWQVSSDVDHTEPVRFEASLFGDLRSCLLASKKKKKKA